MLFRFLVVVWLSDESRSHRCTCTCCSWVSDAERRAAENSSVDCDGTDVGINAIETCDDCNRAFCVAQYDACPPHENTGGYFGAGGHTLARCYKTAFLQEREMPEGGAVLLLLPVVILLLGTPAVVLRSGGFSPVMARLRSFAGDILSCRFLRRTGSEASPSDYVAMQPA